MGISLYSMIIALGIVLVPFMISFIIIQRMMKKKNLEVSLEDRVKVLEAQVQELKDMLDENL